MEETRGVRKLKPRADRPKPFGVSWRVDGAVKSEWFAREGDRDRRYEALVRERQRGGTRTSLSSREASEWLAFKAMIGVGVDWRDVVAGWKAHQQALGISSCDLTVKQACEQYMAKQEELFRAGSLAPDTIRHKRQKIGTLFAEAFGASRLDQVRGADLEEWITEDLGFENADTINTYRKHLKALFGFFSKQVPRNPADDVETRDASVETVSILSVRDTARLFAYALKHRRVVLGRLALETFVGLRFGSGQRVEKTDINFADKGILLPAKKIKTGRRHYIDGLPENLWPWLEATTPDCWTLTPSEWMHQKSELFAKAEVPHPRNCLRHSFATYHVAAYKNPGMTATILCHTNQAKLWSNYNGNATQAFGRLFFSITPETVETIARSTEPQHLPGTRQTSGAHGSVSSRGDQKP
jgi:hypothetical protein